MRSNPGSHNIRWHKMLTSKSSRCNTISCSEKFSWIFTRWFSFQKQIGLTSWNFIFSCGFYGLSAMKIYNIFLTSFFVYINLTLLQLFYVLFRIVLKVFIFFLFLGVIDDDGRALDISSLLYQWLPFGEIILEIPSPIAETTFLG